MSTPRPEERRLGLLQCPNAASRGWANSSVSNEAQEDDLLCDNCTVEEVVADQTTTQGVDIVFGAPLANSTTAGGGTATLFFQWQRKAVGGRFTNIPGATTDTYTVVAPTVADNNGDQYRLKITDEAGSPEVISNAATLTVNP